MAEAERMILQGAKTGADAGSRWERGYPPELAEEESAGFRCQQQQANSMFVTKTSCHGAPQRVALCLVLGSTSTHLLLANGSIW
jgi:hypothetical protein